MKTKERAQREKSMDPERDTGPGALPLKGTAGPWRRVSGWSGDCRSLHAFDALAARRDGQFLRLLVSVLLDRKFDAFDLIRLGTPTGLPEGIIPAAAAVDHAADAGVFLAPNHGQLLPAQTREFP